MLPLGLGQEVGRCRCCVAEGVEAAYGIVDDRIHKCDDDFFFSFSIHEDFQVLYFSTTIP
jgi:hypothetical protein